MPYAWNDNISGFFETQRKTIEARYFQVNHQCFNEIIFNDENNKNGQSELYVYAKSVRLFTSGMVMHSQKNTYIDGIFPGNIMIRPYQTLLGTVCCKTYQPLRPLTAEWNLVIYACCDPVCARPTAPVWRVAARRRRTTVCRMVREENSAHVWWNTALRLESIRR